VAGLLTWASLNLIGGGKQIQEDVAAAQENAFRAAGKQILEWGIENNSKGERADAYLYCVEVKPEGCDYYIPLAPSWVIAEKFQIIVTWDRVEDSDRLQPCVQSVNSAEFRLYKAKKGATIVDGRVIDPFDPNRSWSVEALRGPQGLRRWVNEDVSPQPGDVFQERLYCVRWINSRGERRYAAPDSGDLEREAKVLEFLHERFASWQNSGFIPAKRIPEGGDKTEEPIRTRGWTYWHHLFAPRQLLLHGLISEQLICKSNPPEINAAGMLALGRFANWNSRICQWLQSQGGGIGGGKATFANQALNTLFNFSVRPLLALKSAALGACCA
jgi:putative DNA methylase